ncbi:MAG: hypothetical protein ACPGSD_00130 [Flavobacteriales bacterium]
MKYLILILCLVVFGCKTQEKTEVFVSKTDTLIQIVEKEISIPVVSETIISEPCDSNGILKAFKSKIETTKGTVLVYSDSNKIHAQIESKTDTCENEFIYKTNEVIVYKDKFVRVVVTPWYDWLIRVLFVLLLALYIKKIWL